MKCKLSDIAKYRNEKIAVTELTENSYVSTENMLPNKGGVVTSSSLPTVKQVQKFYKGDVLVSNIRPYFKKIYCAVEDGGCSNDVLVLSAKNNVDKDFLYFVLSDDAFFEYSMATSKGTKMPRGDKQSILNYEVPQIDIEKQRKISSILKLINYKIILNNKINDNLLEQAQSQFDYICEDATTETLNILLDVIETGSRPKGGALSSGIPSIGAEKIEEFGKYDFSNEKYISEDYFSKLKHGIVNSYDVLLYKDGAYTGKSSMSLDGFPHSKCAVNEHVFILRTKDYYAQFFLYFTLRNKIVHQTIYNFACGKAAQPGLNQQELCSVQIKMPSIKQIFKFENWASPLMHQIAINARESHKLTTLRDALLPKLMSGEIDVSNIDI